jgi:hypothetical protein
MDFLLSFSGFKKSKERIPNTVKNEPYINIYYLTIIQTQKIKKILIKVI